MRLPFTVEQFFDTFARYNEAVWPKQWLLYTLGLAAVALAVRGTRASSRLTAAILAVLWLWMGIVYHFVFFRTINPAAPLFAALFVAQAGLLAWSGVWRTRLAFRPEAGADRAIGGVLIAYALVLYPLVGYALGHRYPETPTFGLPCPTTILTLGLIGWAARPRPWSVVVIPVLWALVGTQGAFSMGVWEDLGLPAAVALLAAVELHHRHRDATPGAPRVRPA